MTDTATPAPYPPDTRAKGWRFELDYEKIEQSSTWDLAAEVPMAQHALLMMWYVAWRQEPCGAFPDDDDVIRAKCKVPRKTWEQLRPILMRGWWKADDGLLYHDTITARVLEMLEYRRKEAARRSGNRGKPADSDRSPGVVPRDTHGTPPTQPPDATGSPDTGTGTGTISSPDKPVKKARKRAPPFDAAVIELPDWLDRDLWGEWVQDRRERGKAITERAAGQQLQALEEYRVAGHSPERTIRHAIASGNQGLYPPPRINGAPAGKSFRAQDEEHAAREVAEWTGSLLDARRDRGLVLEAEEVPRGAARIAG